eukprot:4652215-Pleurochrysis_carterae.AAC.1
MLKFTRMTTFSRGCQKSLELDTELALGGVPNLCGRCVCMHAQEASELYVALKVLSARPLLVLIRARVHLVVFLGELVELLARGLLTLKLLEPVADAVVGQVEQHLNLGVVGERVRGLGARGGAAGDGAGRLELREDLLVLRLGEGRNRLVEYDVKLSRTVLARGATLPLDPLALVRDRSGDDQHAAVGVRLAVHHLGTRQRKGEW